MGYRKIIDWSYKPVPCAGKTTEQLGGGPIECPGHGLSLKPCFRLTRLARCVRQSQLEHPTIRTILDSVVKVVTLKIDLRDCMLENIAKVDIEKTGKFPIISERSPI